MCLSDLINEEMVRRQRSPTSVCVVYFYGGFCPGFHVHVGFLQIFPLSVAVAVSVSMPYVVKVLNVTEL